ncbi:MAG: hypothetical protein AVDCRST_MAG13-1768 [uncultured Solirubrobacteraceae bacterium]|uniref:Uncharacterized protein n=1 Tax=uncultured Solirubrobacteraceae bacterium TaxID=1162706 RepID=A0A6J4SDW8_9ACTN|nr:MAG: hypothetical protein AVDCRST_MAG13-1768 [uncultured Solirubrobacteraceae bacterium]
MLVHEPAERVRVDRRDPGRLHRAHRDDPAVAGEDRDRAEVRRRRVELVAGVPGSLGRDEALEAALEQDEERVGLLARRGGRRARPFATLRRMASGRAAATSP